MSKTFDEVLAEDRRLSLLMILKGSDGYQANIYILQQLLQSFGHAVSLDRIKVDMAWLAESGLATEAAIGPVPVYQVNTRGLDVAAGRATVPGVKRPLPE